MKKEERKLREEEERLRCELSKTQEEMAAILEGFEQVVEPDLIDYYSYAYKAGEAKYAFLIKKIRQLYKTLN